MRRVSPASLSALGRHLFHADGTGQIVEIRYRTHQLGVADLSQRGGGGGGTVAAYSSLTKGVFQILHLVHTGRIVVFRMEQNHASIAQGGRSRG